MIPIKGGVDKVTHPNVSHRDSYTKDVSSKPVKYKDHGRMLQPAEWDLSGDATNCVEGFSPFTKGQTNGVAGKRTQSRNQ